MSKSLLVVDQLRDQAATVTVDVPDLVTQADLAGVVGSSLPEDTLLFSHFRSQDDVGVYMAMSSDGYLWSELSDSQMKVIGTSDTVGGRDPMMFYKDGTIYMGVTWYDQGVFDVVFYTTTDGKNWNRVPVTLGATAIGSATVPAPGATHPCNQVWGPCLFETPEGDVYCVISLPYGADASDVNGNVIPDFRQYLAKCTDLATLTFATPTLVTQTGNTQCIIDGHFRFINGAWHMFCKNDITKNIEHWIGTENVTDPYTKVGNVVTTRQSEAPWLVIRTKSLPRYAIYSDDYVNGEYLVTESNDLLTWGSPQPVKTNRNLRHGGILNSSDLDAAGKSLLANMMTPQVKTDNRTQQLTTTNTAFTPRDGYIYYVTGTTAITLGISELSCQEFYILMATEAPAAKVTVSVTSYFDGVNGAGSLVLNGEMHGNRLVKFTRFGNKFVCDAAHENLSRSIGLKDYTGFPNITNFMPIPDAMYTTDGSADYAATTYINSISTAYPDGTRFFLNVQSEITSPANGTINVAKTATVAVPTGGTVVSPGTLAVVEFRKIAGVWRVMN